ncbi:MAG: hypothetical protein H6972_14200 [Gammaproteobacteria bacterium]|nr:hypothetical protein [Gammaproteobacteria bacterium]
MNLISRLVLLALFLIVGIYALAASAWRPLHNWDMIMYIAAAKSYEESDIKSLHGFTYNALQNSVSDAEYKGMVSGKYRQAIHLKQSAFEEQLPFYQIRPLYTGSIYLLYKAGIDIGFATHIVSGVAVFVALILLYLLSASILGHPFAYAVPFFTLIFGVVDIARYSTPDGMAFLALILSAYFLFKDRVVLLLVFLPIMIGIRTDLILYVIPLLLVVALSKSGSRKMAAISVFVSVLIYFAIGTFSNNPGWSTIFYFTLVQILSHPLSTPPTLTIHQYLHALLNGLSDIPGNSNFVLYCLISFLYLGELFSRAKTTSLFQVLKSPAASLYIVSLFFVFSHFILFPVVWNRFFIGPYLIGVFSILVMMTDYWRRCCINRASPHIWGYEQAKTEVSHSELAGVQRRVGRTWIVDGVV